MFLETASPSALRLLPQAAVCAGSQAVSRAVLVPGKASSQLSLPAPSLWAHCYPPITGLPSPLQSGDSGSQCHLSGSRSQSPEPEPWGVSMALTSWGHVQTLRGRQSAPHPRPRLSWCNLHILCRRLRPHTDVGMREAFLTPRLWGTAPQGFKPCAWPCPMSRWGLAEADGAEAAAGLS